MRKMVISFKLPANIHQKDGYFVSYCPALDVFSQGATEKEAKNNLVEALTVFLESCIDRGTLDTVLKECGFRPDIPGDKTVYPPDEYIDVPLPFVAADALGKFQCHA